MNSSLRFLALAAASFIVATAQPTKAQVEPGHELVQLDPRNRVHDIAINSTVATTITFPEGIKMLTGFGLVPDANAATSMGTANKVAMVHYENVVSDTLVVRLLKNGEPCYATVRTAHNIHLLRMVPSDSAYLAVIVPPPGEKNSSVETSPEQIAKTRINFSSDELVGIISKARNRKFLETVNPGLYNGWEERNNLDMAATTKSVTASIFEIQRWKAKDAIVFRAWITNAGEVPFEFEPNGVKVRVGSRSYPAQLVDTSGIVQPGQKIPLDVVLQGNIAGGREALSIQQDFRIELPQEGRTHASAALFGDAGAADGK